MTWADVAIAAAFVLGITVGGAAVIRVTRYVLEYMKDRAPPRGP